MAETGGIGGRFSLTGKVALVTGASSGLGKRFAVTLADAGADVVLAARRTDRLEALAKEIEALGRTAHVVAMDVVDTASIEAAVNEAVEKAGKIDILVNNAGVAVTEPALEQSEENWDFVVDTNLKGAFFVAQAVAKKMAETGGGSIINIASILAERVLKQLVSYAAAKAGLVQATKAMALEWSRYGIRVNAIAPGYIITEINRDFLTGEGGDKMRKGVPMRRFGEEQDLDGPLLLLASDASAYMTGSLITVDGGHVLSVP
ncbi:glucose 1-dehydrogenase [Hwanghaeella sp.]|uniref:glucose 1-dehydrogenase n=1 Tax=Hwanghaeella sp. TaxID=2605943 RepID=UPI003CCBCFC2